MKKITESWFQGHYKRVLDSKGRLSIPLEFLDVLNERFSDALVLTHHYDPCLWVFPTNEWVKIKEKAAKLPLFNRAATLHLRYFISGAVECRIDSEGRIIIPSELYDVGGIRNKIVLAGTGKYMEIWDEDNWNKENKGAFE